MTDWRRQILGEFPRHISPLTLVADPDGLLREEEVLSTLRDRDFAILSYGDPVEFRYAYESDFRPVWDRREEVFLVVVWDGEERDLDSLPYDLLQRGRTLSFSLADLFPHLDSTVIAHLDRSDLDLLYEAHERHLKDHVGTRETCEFILSHVFEIVPDLIKDPSDIISTLINIHTHRQRLPRVLIDDFVRRLSTVGPFGDGLLERLLSHREDFFAFLQERWNRFVREKTDLPAEEVRENTQQYSFSVSGPGNIPFGRDKVQVHLDRLFRQGLLVPVLLEEGGKSVEPWMEVGVQRDVEGEKKACLSRLVSRLEGYLPGEDSRYGDWLHFSRYWAEFNFFLYHQGEPLSDDGRSLLSSWREQIDHRFTMWLGRRYAGLVSLPPSPPVMVHHIPRFLARQREASGKRMALVVIDGLSLDQWLVLRKVLERSYTLGEQPVFAWIPTITSVSRQAIFSGKGPYYFPQTIGTTNEEEKLWKQFWADCGISAEQVVYARGWEGRDLDHLEEILSRRQVEVAGIVVDKIDKIIHGMEMGTEGMYNQISQWARQGELKEILELLWDKGFSPYITSDHGNIEGKGCGRPGEGALANIRGERVRVYPEEELRRKVQAEFPQTLSWDPVGLPESYLPLFAPPRRTFVSPRKKTVSHGGISLEEVIVPFVQVERKEQ